MKPGDGLKHFPSVSLFSKARLKRHPVKFLMQQLSLASAGASCLAYFFPWNESAAVSLQSVKLLRCKSSYWDLLLGHSCSFQFCPGGRAPLLAAQLPVARTSTSPEQPCLVLPSRQRGKEEKISQSPLTPKCKQPCYGAFVKS